MTRLIRPSRCESGAAPPHGPAHVVSALGVALLRSGEVEEGRRLIREGCTRARAHAVWVVLAALEAAADSLGATGRPAAATVCWTVVDAQRAVVLDRTYGSETGLYSSSRARIGTHCARASTRRRAKRAGT